MPRLASRLFLRRSISWLPLSSAVCLSAACLVVFGLLLREDGARTREHSTRSNMLEADGPCVAAIEGLLKALGGWRGRTASGFARLDREGDRTLATEACLPVQTAEVSAPRTTSTIDTQNYCFAEKLNRSERLKSMRHLATVASELEQAGVEFYLDMGTALGAFRHFEMIPYDEDIDIRINAEQKASAKTVLSRLRYSWPQMLFHDTEWENQHWKVHFMDTMDPVLERHVALDIFFYTVNETDGRLQILEPPFAFPIGDIFPLVRRPFNNRWYLTPNSIGAMISGYFPNTTLAQCVFYLHDLPFNQCQQPVVPCLELRERFAFTETLQLPQGQFQFLVDQSLRRRPVVTAVAFVAGASVL